MMYKAIISSLILSLVLAIGGNAQEIVKLNQKGYYARFTPDGENIVVTSSNYSGIKKISLETGVTETLSTGRGEGYNVTVFNDKVVLYSRRGEKSLKTIKYRGNETVLVDKTNIGSALTYESSVKGSTSLPIVARSGSDLFSIELVYEDGLENKILFEEGKNKVWVSLSPDRTKILYTVVGQKTYITNLKGETISTIERAEAPRWANDNTVVYMLTKDNKGNIAAGDVYTFDIEKNKSQLHTLDFDKIALFPAMSADGIKVVFNTEEGELYLINLSK